MSASGDYALRLIVAATLSIIAQAPLTGQNCPTTSSAQQIIHGNDIRTVMSNTGNLFQLEYDNLFQVPFNGPNTPNALFAGGLWLGGFDDVGNLKMAAQTFRGRDQSDYGPGPLTSVGITNPEICSEWDKIWVVNLNEVIRHQSDYGDNGQIDDPISSIFGWPGRGNAYFEAYNGFPLIDLLHFGAPFKDQNGNGIYEPQDGDYPSPFGAGSNPKPQPMVMAWTVYNDNSDIHTTTGGDPLRFQIQLTMYAFSCEEQLLNETLFTSYKIVNRSISPMDSIYLGQWLEPSLGCYTDDAIGSYPEGNSFFIFNKDSVDGDVSDGCGSEPVYYKNPPALSVTFLNRDMTSFTYFNNPYVGNHPNAMIDPVAGAPHEFYRYLTGSWKDGLPFSVGGTGYNVPPTNPTKFAFSGDPNDASSWAMTNDDPGVGDRRILGSVRLPRLNPGKAAKVDLAFVYHNDHEQSNLGNVTLMYERIAQIQDIYNSDFYYACSYPFKSCTDDCVYAGDTDHNGLVNSKDYINVGLGMGATGPARPGPISFIPLGIDDWSSTTEDSTNYKHLDCTGDGKVGYGDFDIVDFYYGNKVSGYKPDTQKYGDEIQIIPERSEMVVDENFFRVKVHFDAPEIDSLYGIVFSFEYDTVKLSPILPFQFEPLFNDGLVTTHQEYGKYDFIMVATDSKNRVVEDQLMVTFIVSGRGDINSAPPIDTIYFRITDVKAVMADGTILDLHGQEVPLYLVQELTSTDDPVPSGFRIYPNPSGGRITIENTGLPIGTPYTVLNSLGQMVTDGQLDGGLTLVDLPEGLFYVVVHEQTARVEKVVIIE